MKKVLKITGITLAILVGLVLIAAGIALAVITSSGHLTKILKHYAPQVVNCETELGNANLTLVKTFPNVSLDIEHVALINPMQGSPSDTLANIDEVTVVLDIKKLLKDKRIEVSQCFLERAFVNIYTNAAGDCNLNVFNTKEVTDTTSATFDYFVDLQEISLKNSTVFFTDERDVLTIQVKGFDMDLNGNYMENDIHAELKMRMDDLYILNYAAPFELTNVNLSFNGDLKQLDQIEGVLSADKPDIHLNANDPSLNDTLTITQPVQFSLKNLSGRYDQGQARLKDFRLVLDGGVEIAENGELVFDFGLKTDTMPLEDIMSYLPKDLQKTLNPNGSKDMVNLTLANGKVAINSSKLPHVLIGIQANKLALSAASLPHPMLNLNGDILLDTDLTKETSDRIHVHGLTAKFKESNLSMKGLVDDLTSGVLLKLDVQGDVLLTDVKNILPKKMKLKGRVNFDLNTDFTIDELLKTLEDFDVRRIWAKAKLKVKYLAFDMDDIHVATPQFDVCLALPASLMQKGKSGAFASVDTKALDAQIGEHLDGNLEDAEIRLFADNFANGIEAITLDATMSFGKLGMVYDTIVAALKQSSLNLTTQPNKNTKGMNARLTFDSGDVEAQLGENYALNTHSLGMNASVQHNKDKTNFLDQWNPEADLALGNARVKIDRLSEDIHVSNMDFFFEPNLLHLIPYFDTLVPVLRTFDGQGEVNLNVETHLWPSYQPKVPSMRAAADIKGKNLIVNDEFTFTKITNMLLVSTNGEYRVDSLDVQLSFLKNQLTLWPSQIGIGRYKAVVDGYMTSEKYAEYHIAVTESPVPLSFGLKIWGPSEKLKFELEKSKYPNLYKPLRHSERRELRQNIRQRMVDRKAASTQSIKPM